eukprot:136898-Rhodomonas_salina.1
MNRRTRTLKKGDRWRADVWKRSGEPGGRAGGAAREPRGSGGSMRPSPARPTQVRISSRADAKNIHRACDRPRARLYTPKSNTTN